MTSIISNMNNHGPLHNGKAPFGYDLGSTGYSEDFYDASEVPPINGPPLLNTLETGFLGEFFGQQTQGPNMGGLDFSSNMNGHDHTQSFDFLLDEPVPSLLSASVHPKNHSMDATLIDGDYGFGGLVDPHEVGNSHNDMMTSTSILDARSVFHQQPRLHIAPPTLQHSSSMPSSSEHPSASYHTLQSAPALSPQHQIFSFRAPVPLGHLDTTVSHTQDFRLDGPRSAPPGQPRMRTVDDASDARYYRFGTDAHFQLDGFQVAHGADPGDRLEKKMLRNLYIIKPEYDSKDSTRPTTPDNADSRKRLRDATEDHPERPAEIKRLKSDTFDSGHSGNESDTRFSERRSTSQPGGQPPAPAPSKVRRMPSTTESNGKHKRKNSGGATAAAAAAAAANSKAPRENLSEEQKRSNHIMSEQKRRNLIKAGFDDLHILVPELRQGGLSKSNVLIEAANYLEQLMRSNAEMSRRLGKSTA